MKIISAFVTYLLLVPGFLILPTSYAAADISVYTIPLINGSFIPPVVESLQDGPQIKINNRHFLAQFHQLPEVAWFQQNGIRALQQVTQNTLVLSLPDGFNTRQLPNLRWMGQLSGNDKISPHAQQKLQANANEHYLLVEAYADVTTQALHNHVKNLGGQALVRKGLPAHFSLVSATAEVFEQLAQSPMIAWVSTPTDTLIADQVTHFCPGAKTAYGTMANFVFAWPGTGWDGVGKNSGQLSYHFLNGTDQIAGDLEVAPVVKALNTWALVADLTFTPTEIPNKTKGIDFMWGVGDHGDNNSFDGTGGAAAHGFMPFPTNPEAIAGDVHFDDDEPWTLNGDFQMYSIALHEIGHALGLSHTDTFGAVMIPFYAKFDSLHPDDIQAIRSLYRARHSNPNLNIYAVHTEAIRDGIMGVEAFNARNTFMSRVFQADTQIPTHKSPGRYRFANADFNADGLEDLYQFDKGAIGTAPQLNILDGANQFKTTLFSTSLPLPIIDDYAQYEFGLGDANADNMVDLFIVRTTGDPSGQLTVTLLSGHDFFNTVLATHITSIPAAGADIQYRVTPGDYNGDGSADLYVLQRDGSLIDTQQLFILNGANNFADILLEVTPNISSAADSQIGPFEIHLGDINDDNQQDILIFDKLHAAIGLVKVIGLSGADDFQTLLLATRFAPQNIATETSLTFTTGNIAAAPTAPPGCAAPLLSSKQIDPGFPLTLVASVSYFFIRKRRRVHQSR